MVVAVDGLLTDPLQLHPDAGRDPDTDQSPAGGMSGKATVRIHTGDGYDARRTGRQPQRDGTAVHGKRWKCRHCAPEVLTQEKRTVAAVLCTKRMHGPDMNI